MEQPSLPDGLAERLAGIREGLTLKWNPRAIAKRAGWVDVYGITHDKSRYDARWELWDTDPDGAEYKIMTIQTPNGEFRQPGEWLVELMNFVNPARFDGSIEKLSTELVDKPNNVMLEVNDKDFDDLIETAAMWHRWADMPKQRVLSNVS